jgi:adenylyl-sulfate kinase
VEFNWGGPSADVAVIGAGAAGVMVAARLLEFARRQHKRIDVLLIGCGEPGRGVAYSTRADCHLLNVPAVKMSATVDDPADFARWLDRAPGDFVPRERFGAYLAEHLDTVAKRGGPARLRRIDDTVVSARTGTGGLRLELRSGRTLNVAAAVLATGALSPSDKWAPPALRTDHRFIANPWAADAIARVPSDQDVLLVGTGLTMVDMAMLLDRPNRVLHAVSRHGLLPRTHVTAPLPPVALPGAANTLSESRDLVLGHIKQCLRDHRDWRPAIDGLRPRTAELWQRLSDEERRTWLTRDAPHWDVRRHRMPPPTASAVTQIRRAGRLRIGQGEVASVAVTGNELDVVLTNGRRVQVGAVVNCTGPCLDVTGDPLMDSLIADGMARPGPLAMGLDTAADGRLLPTRAPLWTIGALRRGNLWETTAFAEIRQQAAEVAAAVLATIKTVEGRNARMTTGRTVWLTGLPSAGKSTVAEGVAERLRSGGVAAEILDGDEIRRNLTPDLGFSRADREENVRRIGYVAGLLARNGITVLVPVIAPYATSRDKVRALHAEHDIEFAEVHVATPVDICADRDVKGLYAKQRAGELSGLTGVDDPYEPPAHPELRVFTQNQSIAESVDAVYRFIERSRSGDTGTRPLNGTTRRASGHTPTVRG